MALRRNHNLCKARINLRMKRNFDSFWPTYLVEEKHRMAVYQGNGPPTVLACNANSDRGWNDPPTLAFAASTTSSSTPRKRLDLRKRVAHDFFSGSGLNSGMANLSMGQHPRVQNPHGQQNTYHHNYNATKESVPLAPINGAYSPLYTPKVNPPPSTTGMQNPYQRSISGQSRMPYNYGSHSPMPYNGSMTPPVFPSGHQNSNLPHAASMPNLHGHASECSQPNNQHSVAPPIFNVNGPPSQIATVGESTAVSSTGSSTSTADATHVGQPLVYFGSQRSHTTITNPVNLSDLGTQAGIPNQANQILHDGRPNEHTQMNKTMPELTTENIEHHHHVRSNSMPDFKPIVAGPATLTAPPTEGYYSKRSSSACSSRQRTPSPQQGQVTQTDKTVNQTDDSDRCAIMMDQLNFALDKCSPKLEKKLYDDVKRKIEIFGKQWTSENLIQEVKDRMAFLAKALTDGDCAEANKIHQTLIVDYSSEVSQWMVAIKKIITASEEAFNSQ